MATKRQGEAITPGAEDMVEEIVSETVIVDKDKLERSMEAVDPAAAEWGVDSVELISETPDVKEGERLVTELSTKAEAETTATQTEIAKAAENTEKYITDSALASSEVVKGDTAKFGSLKSEARRLFDAFRGKVNGFFEARAAAKAEKVRVASENKKASEPPLAEAKDVTSSEPSASEQLTEQVDVKETVTPPTLEERRDALFKKIDTRGELLSKNEKQAPADRPLSEAEVAKQTADRADLEQVLTGTQEKKRDEFFSKVDERSEGKRRKKTVEIDMVQPKSTISPEESSARAKLESDALAALEGKMGSADERTPLKERAGILARGKEKLGEIKQSRAAAKEAKEKKAQHDHDRAEIERIVEGTAPVREAVEAHLIDVKEDAEIISEIRGQINAAIEQGNVQVLKNLAEALNAHWDAHLELMAAEPVSKAEKKLYRDVLRGKAELPFSASQFNNLILQEAFRARAAIANIKPAEAAKVMIPEGAPSAEAIAEAVAAPASPETASRETVVELPASLKALQSEAMKKIEDRLREIDRLAGSYDERQKAGVNMQKLEVEAATLLDEKKQLERKSVPARMVTGEINLLENQLREIESTLKKEKETLNPDQKGALYRKGESLESQRKELKQYLAQGEKPKAAAVEAPVAVPTTEAAIEAPVANADSEGAKVLTFTRESDPAEAQKEKSYLEALNRYVELYAQRSILRKKFVDQTITPDELRKSEAIRAELNELNFGVQSRKYSKAKSSGEIGVLVAEFVRRLLKAEAPKKKDAPEISNGDDDEEIEAA